MSLLQIYKYKTPLIRILHKNFNYQKISFIRKTKSILFLIIELLLFSSRAKLVPFSNCDKNCRQHSILVLLHKNSEILKENSYLRGNSSRICVTVAFDHAS